MVVGRTGAASSPLAAPALLTPRCPERDACCGGCGCRTCAASPSRCWPSPRRSGGTPPKCSAPCWPRRSSAGTAPRWPPAAPAPPSHRPDHRRLGRAAVVHPAPPQAALRTLEWVGRHKTSSSAARPAPARPSCSKRSARPPGPGRGRRSVPGPRRPPHPAPGGFGPVPGLPVRVGVRVGGLGQRGTRVASRPARGGVVGRRQDQRVPEPHPGLPRHQPYAMIIARRTRIRPCLPRRTTCPSPPQPGRLWPGV
jgi:hypothetical protein